jgi:predicted pyridoxine 5'-phosphate oxidase superfamily flavin-nucleotide-binding protein
MITAEMQSIIERNTIGFVATVTPEGEPAVSPNGTTIVLDAATLLFSDIRSPGTVRNIRANPAVEINFLDVLSRKACRLKGRASYIPRGEPRFAEYLPQFSRWESLVPMMRGLVRIDVASATLIRSPVYDTGATEAELVAQWRAYYGG